MNTRESVPEKNRGFTLVELLVVIAIIGILAGIVLPNVTKFIEQSKVTRAVADIQSIETAVTGMLSDTQRSDFTNWFLADTLLTDAEVVPAATVVSTTLVDVQTDFDTLLTASAGNPYPLSSTNRAVLADHAKALEDFYTNVMYQLIRQGKNAEIRGKLQPEIRQKLGNSYITDLGLDPWGQQYRFWLGPMRGKPQMFRSYRLPEDVDVDRDDFPLDDAYRFDQFTRDKENEDVPGQQPADYEALLALTENGTEVEYAFYGAPASKDLSIYVYSRGKNNLVDANAILQPAIGSAGDYAFYGGGDDINNWDNEQGWTGAPK